MKELKAISITPTPPSSIWVSPKNRDCLITGGSKTYREATLSPHISACLLKLQNSKFKQECRFRKEIERIASLQDCQGIVHLFYTGTYQNSKGREKNFAIYEKHPLSLEQALKTKYAQDPWKIARSLLETLTYIHKKGIIHHDLNLKNILINEKNGTAVLIDFGSSFKKGEDLLTIEGLTKYYAPEYQSAVDLYRASRRLGPLQEATTDKIDCYALGKLLEQLPTPQDDRFHSLIQGLLHPIPQQRLSAEQALQLCPQ